MVNRGSGCRRHGCSPRGAAGWKVGRKKLEVETCRGGENRYFKLREECLKAYFPLHAYTGVLVDSISPPDKISNCEFCRFSLALASQPRAVDLCKLRHGYRHRPTSIKTTTASSSPSRFAASHKYPLHTELVNPLNEPSTERWPR